MLVFIYSAADRAGKTVKGEREAEDEKKLAQSLKAEGFFLLEAKQKSSGLSSFANFNTSEFIGRFRPIGIVDKMFFAKNLAVMVSSGLSLSRALEALSEESPNPRFKKIINEINDSVIKGKTLAESLRVHQEIFGDLFISMVEVGEVSGKLTSVLKLVARQMKKDYDLKRRVRGAMIYPAIVLIALFGIGAMMMIYVVPTLSQTIKELGVDLPLSTRLIIFASDFVAAHGLTVFVSAVVLAVLFWKALKTQRGIRIFDTFILKAPLFGKLIKNLNTARFSRILAYLITSGVSIVQSLEITSAVLGNTLFREAVKDASVKIQGGKRLQEILATYPGIFPPLVLEMISVGEETGKIAEILLHVALFFEEEVNATTKNMSTIIEPLLMIIIGVVVGFFAVAMFQPIYGSLGNIQ